MKIKTLLAVALLVLGANSTFAQTEDCNKNSSISHEAVRSKDFKSAYLPWQEVLKNCPTLKYYTYTDGQKILRAFLDEIKDRNSADYQKYFDELMQLHDKKIENTPYFVARLKGTPSVGDALGIKAMDYISYAPKMDPNEAYVWLKQSVDEEKSGSKGPILHYFLEMSLNKLKADANFKEEFFQDYLTAADYADEAVMQEQDSVKKEGLRNVKDNIEAMFINSGTADCATLESLFGPKVEAAKDDSTYLKKAIAIMKVMQCTENEAYFKASDYMYRIHPTADAATGCGFMSYKKGDYDEAIKYFDQAMEMETNPDKQAKTAYAAAAAMFNVKRYGQAKANLLKAINYRPSFGDAYILLAQLYATNSRWSDEPALNACSFYVVIDKLQRARSVDPKVADRANELIGTYRGYLPKMQDLFMLGHKAGDRIQIGGLIGETAVIR
jgi:tetratricopeptide (TPR) repeat protein